MGEDATILHADADSFYASVEQRDDPGLRGKPVIVGGGVVLAASYEAKAFGIYTPMGERQARRLCPQAIVVRPRMEAYSEASEAMFEVFNDTTPLVEGLSIDEAFLDVGGLGRISGTPEAIARRLRGQVRERVGIPVTVGVARTKFLAKVASGVAKPDGLLLVPPPDELTFLHALPVERLWGVGPVTARKLHARGITLVAEVAELDEAALVGMLGRASGRHLHALAHNRDPRRVEVGRRRHSMGTQRALGRRAQVAAAARHRPDRARRPPRAAPPEGPPGLSDRDLASAVRRPRARHPVAHGAGGDGRHPDAAHCRAGAARRRAPHDRGARHHADRDHVQQPVPGRRGPGRAPFDGASSVQIDGALDVVRKRFGSKSVTRGVLLGRRDDLQVPLLPDPMD